MLILLHEYYNIEIILPVPTATYNQGVGFVDFVTEKVTTILDHNRSLVLTITVHPEKLANSFITCKYLQRS